LAKIISIHSFRGGTGKSNVAANLAYTFAKDGKRVGVIDADVQSPGIHNLFGLEGKEITASLNDYLLYGRDILETALDVTSRLEGSISGQLYLIPSSIDPNEIANILRHGYGAEQLTRGLRSLVDGFNLDVLIIDTHPGLNEETLLSLIISHALIILMRPDKQDYEGTGITIRVARELEVPHMTIVVNKAPSSLQMQAIKEKVQEAFGCEVAGVIPHSEEMMSLASASIFASCYPNHPITTTFRHIAEQLVA
jgi:MinD-like ATPase involved in chromosome partitioning or flagellar assembly